MIPSRCAAPAMLAVMLSLLLAPGNARADCPGDVASAYRRANALPPTSGRAALLEQIQRAEIAHHEGDEEECRADIADAFDVLSHVRATAASSPR